MPTPLFATPYPLLAQLCHALRTIAGVRCLIVGAPTCCIAARFFTQDFDDTLDARLPESGEAPQIRTTVGGTHVKDLLAGG